MNCDEQNPSKGFEEGSVKGLGLARTGCACWEGMSPLMYYRIYRKGPRLNSYLLAVVVAQSKGLAHT